MTWRIGRPYDTLNACERFIIYNDAGKEVATGCCSDEVLKQLAYLFDNMPEVWLKDKSESANISNC